MDADVLILAAGFGKRLQPLTLERPKALIDVGGRTLIDRNLDMVARAGFSSVFINLHYLGEQIERHVGDGKQWKLSVTYSPEPVILDTGGAIKKIEPLFRHNDLLTVNSDVLIGPEFDLRELLLAHRGSGADVTAVVRPDPGAASYGELEVDGQGRVTRFLGRSYGTGTRPGLMYTGIQAISRRVLSLMPEAGSVFSITRDTWVKILESGGRIGTVIFNGYWNDVGTLERLESARNDIKTIYPA